MDQQDRFLDRVLALRGHPQGRGIVKKLMDGYLLGPSVARGAHSVLVQAGAALPELLRRDDIPIHWIRPGGIGDWAVLAPYVRAVRSLRRHPGDTLWVGPEAVPFAQAYHASEGLEVRTPTLRALAAGKRGGLALQLEPFHPTAWIWVGILGPAWVAGFPPRDPRALEGPPSRPMKRDIEFFHPGLVPPEPQVDSRGDEILVFERGNHRSRALPGGTARRLADAGFQRVVWFGDHLGFPIPPGWEWISGKIPPKDLIARIAGASLVLSPDSGPFHLARLLGTPSVGYFTSGEVVRWGWPERGSRVLVSGFHCTGCTRIAMPRPCPHSYGCVDDGDVETIISACRH